MPTISEFRPTQLTSISGQASQANIDRSGAGAIAQSVSKVASDINQVANQFIWDETQAQARQSAFENTQKKREYMDVEYDTALKAFDPSTGRVIFKDENGEVANDTGMSLHEYLGDKSEAYDLTRVVEPPSDLARREWGFANESLMAKYYNEATADRILQRNAYDLNMYTNNVERVSKSLQQRGSSLTSNDVADSVRELKRASAVYKNVTTYSNGAKIVKDSESNTAFMGVDALLDNGSFKEAFNALLLPNKGSTEERNKIATSALKNIVKDYFGTEANYSGVQRTENGDMIIESNKGSIVVNDRGFFPDPNRKPVGEVISTPMIGIEGDFTPDKTVYDALSDDHYSQLVNRTFEEAKKNKSEAAERALQEQKNLIAMMLDQNSATRKTPDFNNPLQATTEAVLGNIDAINNSMLPDHVKEQATAELLSAGVASKVMSNSALKSPEEVANEIKNVDSQVDKYIDKLQLDVSPNLTNISKIKVREMLGAGEIERAKKLSDPNYYMANSSGLRNTWRDTMSGSGTFDKYITKLNQLKTRTGTPLHTPIFPKAYTESLVKQITETAKADTAGVMQAQATIKDLQAKMGSNFPRLWAELEEAKLPKEFKFIADFDRTPEGDRASSKVLSNLSNAQAINDSFKKYDPTGSVSKDIDAAVHTQLLGMSNYLYSVNGFSGGAEEDLAFKNNIALEAKRLLVTGEKTSEGDAVKEAKHTIMSRNYFADDTTGTVVSRGLLQANNLTEDEASSLAETFSDPSSIIDRLDMDSLISPQVKAFLKQQGSSTSDEDIKRDFINGDYGTILPVFTPQGIALRFNPRNNAPAFYLFDKNKRKGAIVIPYNSAKENPAYKTRHNGKVSTKVEGILSADPLKEGNP